jgi:3-oxoacyl-[acyl-carrier protein] reductase
VRTFLVSGSTSGIGRAIAGRLGAQGDRVIPLVRTADGAPPGALVADFADVRTTRAAVRAFDQPLDGFVNAAGIGLAKSLFDYGDDDLERIFAVNLLAPMAVLAELKGRIRPGGLVVLISSEASHRGSWDDPYAVTKGGINALVRTLAAKFAPDVRVVGVAPGITLDTRMTAGKPPETYEGWANRTLLKRLARPDEIADLVAALTGPAGASMTGVVIDANGGSYLR